MIAKKLRDDLALNRVIEVPEPKPPFISAPLGLVPKQDSGFPRIPYLSYLKGISVNGNIPDRAGELQYAKFQEVLDLNLQARRHRVI